VRHEGAYRGPFTRRTLNPILTVGNLWDPVTDSDGAVKVASVLPNKPAADQPQVPYRLGHLRVGDRRGGRSRR